MPLIEASQISREGVASSHSFVAPEKVHPPSSLESKSTQNKLRCHRFQVQSVFGAREKIPTAQDCCFSDPFLRTFPHLSPVVT
jgi:hypothetical protein